MRPQRIADFMMTDRQVLVERAKRGLSNKPRSVWSYRAARREIAKHRYRAAKRGLP